MSTEKYWHPNLRYERFCNVSRQEIGQDRSHAIDYESFKVVSSEHVPLMCSERARAMRSAFAGRRGLRVPSHATLSYGNVALSTHAARPDVEQS